MNNTNEKLLHTLSSIEKKLEYLLPNSSQKRVIDQLFQDMKNDYYTIVVAGEFKNGKSTFVNALIGEELMPVDVTPTTAVVNAVFYNENRFLEVLKSDGVTEKKELSKENLSNFTAQVEFNHEEIQYLKVHLPSPILKNRLVLVDTPGVNDLNEHRIQVTHQFIPRADAILFLLDVKAPLKKTEEKFLKEQLMKNGLNKIIFIANFIDRLDEDEDLDELKEFITRRIQFITESQEEPNLILISGLMGYHAKIQNNHQLLHMSGLFEVEAELEKILSGESRASDKLDRYETRLGMLASEIVREIETATSMSKQSVADLEMQVEAIDQWFQKEEHWKNETEGYILQRKEEILYIVQKSVRYFGDRLIEDMKNRVLMFYGGDIRHFVEAQLPILIKSQFTQWTDQYGEQINELLRKLEQELSKGLSNAFNENIRLFTKRDKEISFDGPIPVMTTQSGNAGIKAGIIIGGASSVALLLGAGFFIPIVGMAGLPFLQQKIAEKQLENIKPELLFNLESQLNVMLDQLQQKLFYYIEDAVTKIKNHALYEFQQRMESIKAMMEHEIKEKQENSYDMKAYQNQLQEFHNWLEKEILQKEGDMVYE